MITTLSRRRAACPSLTTSARKTKCSSFKTRAFRSSASRVLLWMVLCSQRLLRVRSRHRYRSLICSTSKVRLTTRWESGREEIQGKSQQNGSSADVSLRKVLPNCNTIHRSSTWTKVLRETSPWRGWARYKRLVSKRHSMTSNRHDLQDRFRK